MDSAPATRTTPSPVTITETPAADLKAQFDSAIGASPPRIRVIVAGVPFDFEILRLKSLFPNNVFEVLAKSPRDQKFAEDDPRIQVIRLDVDIMAMRIIYAYYMHHTIIVPKSDVDRQALELACDYLGTPEFIDRLAAIEQVAGPQEVADRIPATGGIPAAENAPAKQDANEFIPLPNTSDTTTRVPIVVRPACELTREDAKIQNEELKLRREFAAKEQGLSGQYRPPTSIPIIDAIAADKSRVPQSENAVPYTILRAPNDLPDWQWVETLAEFESNLRILSLGVLTSDNLPLGVAIAGGAALSCLARRPMPDAKTVKMFAAYYSLDVNADTSPEDLTKAIISASPPSHSAPAILRRVKLTNSQTEEIGRFLAIHAAAFMLRGMGNRYYRSGPAPPVEVTNFVKKISKTKRLCSDIDVFLTTDDPTTIKSAIETIYNRMASLGNTAIVRTENAVSFILTAKCMTLQVQIILRSYESPGQIIVGFDVDSCCVAYAGGRAICSPRFLRALRLGYNLIDLTRISPTYEIRLMKYLGRGFAIAMTQPSLMAHVEQLTSIMDLSPRLAIYPTLIGITRLAFLVCKKFRIAKTSPIGAPKFMSDYGVTSIKSMISAIADARETTDFVLGEHLQQVLYGSVSRIPKWLRHNYRWMRHTAAKIENKQSSLGPIQIRRIGVAEQGNSSPLFTGSFNPIHESWYQGGITYPDVLLKVMTDRVNPAGGLAKDPRPKNTPLPVPPDFKNEIPQDNDDDDDDDDDHSHYSSGPDYRVEVKNENEDDNEDESESESENKVKIGDSSVNKAADPDPDATTVVGHFRGPAPVLPLGANTVMDMLRRTQVLPSNTAIIAVPAVPAVPGVATNARGLLNPVSHSKPRKPRNKKNARQHATETSSGKEEETPK